MPTNALVQIGETPAMALCDICPKPGRCCKDFTLTGGSESFTFWKDEDPWAAAREVLRNNNLPFQPSRISGEFTFDEEGAEDFGREYVTFYFSCPKVSAEGRCTIYPFRPDVCRIFVPGSNCLCVFDREPFKHLWPFREEDREAIDAR